MFLLAQLIAPPLQPGPVRLPETAPLERPSQKQIFEGDQTAPAETPAPSDSTAPYGPSTSWRPPVQGKHPYSVEQLESILQDCGRPTVEATLKRCAALLTARLIQDGYVNSRVYTLTDPSPGALDVVLGRIAELRVTSSDEDLKARVEKQLQPLIGTVLHLPTIEQALVKVRRGGVGDIKGNMGRLGSDPTQAVVSLSVEPAGPTPLRGDFSFGNNGNVGSGEWSGVSTLLQNDFLTWGDSALWFLQLDSDGDPELGNKVISATYTWPLSDQTSITGSLGYSRSRFVEFQAPSRNFSFRTLQSLLQLQTSLLETDRFNWSGSAALSASRSDSYDSGRHIGLVAGGGDDGWSRSGYLKLSTNLSGLLGNSSFWSANLYAMQGIAGITHDEHLHNHDLNGIEPGRARAIGSFIDVSWPIRSDIGLNLRAGGQLAFNPLPGSMGFSLGSNTGLRGLPGTVISGDNGWLGTAEVVITPLRKDLQAIQLIPFVGYGGYASTRFNTTFRDDIGSAGLIARYINAGWQLELGWVTTFLDQDNPGLWNDWVLGHGLHTKVRYSF
ncbi:polypeptide-transport-associated protein/ ShlB-type [Synechococcus sp. A18-46.1]|nr:polypeptide-transport-associated protein/ ShlB-type [Synechococcus sp. A18-46.1]